MGKRLSTRLLQTQDVCQRLGVSDQMVRLLSDAGQLPSIRTARGWRLFREGDVARLAQERARRRRLKR